VYRNWASQSSLCAGILTAIPRARRRALSTSQRLKPLRKRFDGQEDSGSPLDECRRRDSSLCASVSTRKWEHAES